MGIPQFKAAGALFAAASGTSITPVIPTGTVAGDIMIFDAMVNVASTFTTPTGWTVLGTNVNSANQSTAWFIRRFVAGDGNPTSTTSVTGSASAGLYGRIYVFRNVTDAATFYEAVAQNGAPTTSTTPSGSAVTTTAADRLVCSLLDVDDDTTFSSGMPPANWTQVGRVSSTTGGDAHLDAIWRPAFSAQTMSAPAFGTMSAAAYWRATSLALIGKTGGTSLRHLRVAPTTTTPKATSSVEWGSGDVIVVASMTENNTVLLSTPTATGLTFSSLGTIGNPGNPTDTGPAMQLWSATAGSAGSSTISVARSSAAGNYGFHVWVISGGTLQTPVLDLTEAAPSLTVQAGSLVLYAKTDWNATAAGKTPSTGSGYATERIDVLNTGFHEEAIDWVDTAAGTFSFGQSAYTSENVAQFALEVRPTTTGSTVTGTAVASLGALTATANGTVTTPPVTGTAVGNFGALSATVSAVRTIVSTAVATLGALSAAATGVRSFTGTAAANLGTLAGTATATVTHPATAASNLGGLGATAAGSRTVLATADASLGALSATANGFAGTPPVTGTAAATLGGLTATSSGVRTVVAAAAVTFGGLGATGTATVTRIANVAATLGALGATINGAVSRAGTAATNFGALDAVAVGARSVLAAASAALGQLTATALGTIPGFSEPGSATAELIGPSASATLTGAAASAVVELHAATAALTGPAATAVTFAPVDARALVEA